VKIDRAARARCLAFLEAGDVVVVTKLDRLARSSRDLLNILVAIGEAGATFKSLADTWADTTTPHGRLMLKVLGGLAEFETSLDPQSDPGRSGSCGGKGCQVRSSPQAHQASAGGSKSKGRPGRDADGDS
jgi:hypothetical protein